MNMNPLLLLCVTCAIPFSAVGQGSRDDRTAVVEVIAFDTNGRYLGAPTASLFEADDHTSLAPRFRNGAARSVPFGIYRIEARLPGYSSEVRYVRVFQPSVSVILGLTFSLELPAIPPSLQGHVVGLIPPRTFVRLIGVYSSTSMESTIDSEGNFRLGGLSDGQFLLLVVSQDGILASKAISIPYTGERLQIEIKGRG